jgi:chitodextrinase
MSAIEGARHPGRSRVASSALVLLGLTAVALVALAPAGTAESAKSGLVAAYGFEEAQGATATDASGNGNKGALVDAARTSSGAYGSGIRLRGSGVGVVVPDSSSLHLRGAGTLVAWVRPASMNDAWRDVVYKGDDTYYLESSSPTRGAPAAGGRFAASGHHTEAFAPGPLTPNAWAYLTLTYDGSNLRLYVDGSEVASVPETQVLRSSTRPLQIGGDDIYGQYFEGTVDEVRIYDVARSPDQIRNDMDTPVVAGTAGDRRPPSAPGALSAAAASAGSIHLSWGAASDNVGVSSYELFRCKDTGCSSFSQVGQVDGMSTSYADDAVDASSSYSYEVRAVDAAGNAGPFSNVASATTPAPPDREPPLPPAGLAASAVDQASITLSWDAAADNVGVTGYRIYLDGTQVDSTSATSYLYSRLTCGTAYSLGVAAVDAANNVSALAALTQETAACSDESPPTAPTDLTAAPKSSSEIDLSWTAATDNVAVTKYEVWRCDTPGCSSFSQIATTAATSFEDTGLAATTSYSYEVRALDAAGNIGPYSKVAATNTLEDAAKTPGPLRVDPSGRYLLDRNGTPFLMTGDSPQALIGDLTEADAALYFSTRRAQGFNTVWINLLCNNYTGCNSDGSTWDGISPFTTPGDVSTPNEAYFARVDKMIQLATKYGFVILLDPAETAGWLTTLVSSGVDKDRAYGAYVGARYAAFSNIVWISGNDYQAWGDTYDPYVTAVAQGIRAADPSALQTVELNYFTSGSLDDPTWAPLIDLNASYTYNPTYIQVLKDYNRPNFLPTFLAEGSYEDEQNVSTVPAGTTQQLRRQEYWSLLSGASGQMYGNHSVWQFLCSQRDVDGNCIGGWKDELASSGAKQMANVLALFSPRRWYELIPDQDHSLVTGGFGTFGDDDYVTAARTSDGKLAIAYAPSAATITVDLGTLAGPVTARWYDPTSGTYATIGGSPLPNAGSASLTTPGLNGEGADDWVLVLETP